MPTRGQDRWYNPDCLATNSTIEGPVLSPHAGLSMNASPVGESMQKLTFWGQGCSGRTSQTDLTRNQMEGVVLLERRPTPIKIEMLEKGLAHYPTGEDAEYLPVSYTHLTLPTKA